MCKIFPLVFISMMARRELERAYLDPKNSTAFSSFSALKRYFKGKYSDQEIKNFLASQETYTKYAPRRSRFNRRYTLAHEKDDIWVVDLAVFADLKKSNKGYAYLAVFVDVLTRKTRFVKLKTRKAAEIIKEFGRLFSKIRPRILFSDAEGSFVSRAYKNFLAEYNITSWIARNTETHAALAEKKIHIIKQRLFRYFHEYNTNKWVDVIEKIIDGINNSYSRNIGQTPNSIKTLQDQQNVFLRLYGKKLGIQSSQLKNKKNILKVGDRVRLSLLKDAFTKKYLQSFSDDRHTIAEVNIRQGIPLYKLKDDRDKKSLLVGEAYRDELILTK